MKKEIPVLFNQILLHLEERGMLTDDFPRTEDALMKGLNSNPDEQKRILIVLVSLFSEDYKSHFLNQNGLTLDYDLAHRIAELGLTDGNRYDFVLGKCTLEEQKKIYDKLFKYLHLSLTAQEHDQDNFSSDFFTEDLPEQGSELLSKTLKKRASKNVDTKELNELLEKAKNSLELINLMEQKRTSLVQIQSKKLEDDQDEESKLSKLLSTLQSLLQDMKERIIVSPLSCAEKIPVPAGCGSTITELYPTLQFVANCLELPSVKLVTRETIDMEEISAQARKLELSSIVKKLETE